MTLPVFLAQAPAPSVTATISDVAAAIPATAASPTVTTAPAPTPYHIVVDHGLFWNSGLGILLMLLAAIVIGLIIGLAVRKGGMEVLGKFFNDFTNVLAYVVVVLAFCGILLLSYEVLKPSNTPVNLDTAKYVFAAILPLLGTWVGTVLAHYFQKENLAAATQSITSLASKVGGMDKLQSTPVKTVMIRPDRIDTLPDPLLDKKDEDIKLRELLTHLREGIKRDRLPIFKDNKKSGPAERVLHRSTVEKFVSDKALASAPPKPIPDLSLADLMADSQLGAVIRGSFALVKSDDTLADAKNAMDKASAALGPAGSCYDVFVTEAGKADESVIGWITNDIINENAKV